MQTTDITQYQISLMIGERQNEKIQTIGASQYQFLRSSQIQQTRFPTQNLKKERKTKQQSKTEQKKSNQIRANPG